MEEGPGKSLVRINELLGKTTLSVGRNNEGDDGEMVGTYQTALERHTVRA